MGKRLIITILLCWVILFGWSTLATKLHLVENKAVTPSNLPAAPPASISTVTPTLVTAPSESPSFKISQPKWEFIFGESDASIREVTFPDYQLSKFNLQYGLLLGDGSLQFKKERSSPDSLAFVYKDKEKEILKVFLFHNDNYTNELKINVQNNTSKDLDISLPLIVGILNTTPSQTQPQSITVALEKNIMNFSPNKNSDLKEIRFLALKDKYFSIIVQSDEKNQEGFVRKISGNKTEVGLILKTGIIKPGEQLTRTYLVYLGPQDNKLINAANPQWTVIMSYGSLDFIAQVTLKILEFFYKIVGSWGWAIVILGVLVFVILFPLTRKQMHSIKAMQALQPQIDALRKMYKDNPQKLNKEMMELWRTHKINPLGGCLPLLLQLPVILVLFQVLSRHIALKGAHFLWVKDLSGPDRLFVLPNALPLLGNEINLLPIVFAILMFIQQKISVVKTSPEAQQQQKMMVVLLPIIFAFFLYHMPAGLVIYWLVNSSLMLIYQLKLAK